MSHWRGTLKYWLCVLIAFFIGHSLDLVYHNAESLSSINGQLTNKVNDNFATCNTQIETIKAFADQQRVRADSQSELSRLLKNQKDAQQSTIDSDQGQLNAQQGVVSQCVVSLGKMNPKIREQIIVVQVPLGMQDDSNQWVTQFAPHKLFVTELFIVTNEPEVRFHGAIRCSEPFTIRITPAIPTSVTAMMRLPAEPVQISDREYEVRFEQSNTEWNPSHPAYLQVLSNYESLGTCSFAAME